MFICTPHEMTPQDSSEIQINNNKENVSACPKQQMSDRDSHVTTCGTSSAIYTELISSAFYHHTPRRPLIPANRHDIRRAMQLGPAFNWPLWDGVTRNTSRRRPPAIAGEAGRKLTVPAGRGSQHKTAIGCQIWAGKK